MAWFEPSLPFVAGWGAPPHLEAPNISGTLGEILQQRRYEQAQMQKNIADTIKNVRSEMQANKYLDSLKEQGLVPQDYEAGGIGGATYGTGLAKLIQDKKEADALAAYRDRLAGVAETRASRVGGGGDEEDAGPLDPAEQRRQDAERRREENDRLKAIKDQMKLAELPSDAVPHALAPGETVLPGTYPFDVGGKRQDIPQSKVDQFNTARRAYDEMTKQRAQVPGVSSGGTKLASQDDIRRARARQALDDPEATPEEKRQAAIILSQ